MVLSPRAPDISGPLSDALNVFFRIRGALNVCNGQGSPLFWNVGRLLNLRVRTKPFLDYLIKGCGVLMINRGAHAG